MLWRLPLSAAGGARQTLLHSASRRGDVFTPVGALSGGEKSRLRLCMLMGSDINLLDPRRADKPFGHCQPRVDGGRRVGLFRGAAVRFARQIFYRKNLQRVWYLDGGKLLDYRGTYEQMREYLKRQEVFTVRQRPRPRPQKPDKSAKKSSPNKEKAHSKDRA